MSIKLPAKNQKNDPGREISNKVWQVLFILILLGPVLALFLRAGQDISRGHQEWLALIIPTGRQRTLFLRTVGLSAGVSAAGIAFGSLASSLLWQWNTKSGRFFRWFLLILAPLPPYIHALAWSSVFMLLNRILRQWGLVEVVFRGWAASWWVQTMALLPVSVGLGLIGLNMIDPDLVDAARLQSNDWRWLRKIALPLASPAILTGAGLLFVLSLVDYSVPSLFQLNVYSLEIFADFSANNQPGRALILSLPLWILASLILWISNSWNRLAVLTPPWRQKQMMRVLILPVWVKGLQYMGLLILFGQFLVPLLSQFYLVNSWETFYSSLRSAVAEIQVTFWISLGTALICLPLAFFAGHRLMVSNQSRWWWGLIMLPIAIPASLVGIGLVTVWNNPSMPGLYGTAAMPVLAGLTRFTSFATLLIFVQMRLVKPSLIEAAVVHQKNSFQRVFQVQLPLYAPGIMAAAIVVFILSMGELGATLIVSPPGMATLTMRIYNYLHYGASDTVAGLCLAITLTTLIFGGSAAVFINHWTKLVDRHKSE